MKDGRCGLGEYRLTSLVTDLDECRESSPAFSSNVTIAAAWMATVAARMCNTHAQLLPIICLLADAKCREWQS